MRYRPYSSLLSLLVAASLAAVGCTDLSTVWPFGDDADQPFVEVTHKAGLGDFHHETGFSGEKWFPETLGGGLAFFDYESDGDQDLLLVGGSTWPSKSDSTVPGLWLYRNMGNGVFEHYTHQAGLSDVHAYGFGVTTADYDNDGDPDIYLTTLHRNHLYRNDDGVFAEVGETTGVAGPSEWSTAAVFFDADKDGHLDLYVGNYVRWSPKIDMFCTLADGETEDYCTPEHYEGLASRFYHNNGDGTFTERSESAGLHPFPGKTLGASLLDYNRDGWPDLVVANDGVRNLLFENEKDGTFKEVGTSRGLLSTRASMGIDVGYVDSTGYPMVAIGNFTTERMGIYQLTDLGVFEDRSGPKGIDETDPLTFGLFFFDVELDGDPDLFVANGPLGHIPQDSTGVLRDNAIHKHNAQLYLNDGAGSFQEVHTNPGGLLSTPMIARGAAYADVDGDGDLDVAVMEVNGPVHLWENRTQQGHYLRVRLEGTVSNRDAIGARVVAALDGRRLQQRVRTGSSYLSQFEKPLTFGLGRHSHVDTLWVHWPAGAVARRVNVDADQTLHITEEAPSATARRSDAPAGTE